MSGLVGMLRNLAKNLGYHQKEVRSVIDQVEFLEHSRKTLADGYATQMNTIELQRIKIAKLEAKLAKQEGEE